jgi:hypothetical protein
VIATTEAPTTMSQVHEELAHKEQLCNLTVLNQPPPSDGQSVGLGGRVSPEYQFKCTR